MSKIIYFKIFKNSNENLNNKRSYATYAWCKPEDVKVEYLGRKGLVTLLLRRLGELSTQERPKIGQLLNQTKREIEELLKIKKRDKRCPRKQSGRPSR